ncbi:hypothetical protein ABZP36_034775 [Zizania latifolia]
MSSSVGGGGGGGAGGAGGDIASLLDKAKELDQLRKEQDEVVTEINKMHKKILTSKGEEEEMSSPGRGGCGGGGGGGRGQGYVGHLLEKLNHLEKLQKDQDCIIKKINEIHRQLRSSSEMVDKSLDATLVRLRSLYSRAKELCDNEISASSALVGMLDGLLQSGVSAPPRKKIEVGEQKKKRMKSDTDTARFSSASMRSQLDQATNLKGEQVAAKVKSDEEKDEWFVVKVIHFDKETKEYEVLDEEPGDDEESAQKKYKLPMSDIIPFPKKGDPSSAPDFGQGRQVLAVYPGTTALYRATVASNRKRKSDDYILLFDDDEEDGSLPQRAVPFYRVVALPEGHRQ